MKVFLAAVLTSCLLALGANLVLTHALQTTSEQAFSTYSARP